MTTEPRRLCAGPCGKNRQEKFFTGPRGRICVDCQKKNRRKTSRNAHVARTYGLTVKERDALLDAQGGACAICKGTRPYQLAVDHDHEIEKLWGMRASIRGLLCKKCNKLLRDVRDSTELLEQLAEYLKNPPAQAILKENKAA